MCELLFDGEFGARMPVVCSELGLTPGLVKTLHQLVPGEDAPMRELADQWHCDASWVTSLADQLEERGLVERRPHPTDRRVKTLVLTPEGLEVRARVQEVLFAPGDSLDRLTAAEQRQLRDLVRKLGPARRPPAG